MKRTFRIDLPWPHRGLSPNARLNRYAKATLFKTTKTVAYVQTKKQMADQGFLGKAELKPDGLVNIQLVFTPPINRYRDEDNMLANCKAVLDGVAQAIGVNDHYFHFLEQIWLKPKHPGALKLLIDCEDGNE